jgi:hypothetical protein
MAFQIPFSRLIRAQQVPKARPFLLQPGKETTRSLRRDHAGQAAHGRFAVPNGDMDAPLADDDGFTASFYKYVQNDVPDSKDNHLAEEFNKWADCGSDCDPGRAMLERSLARPPIESDIKVVSSPGSPCCKGPLLHYSGQHGEGQWCTSCGARQFQGENTSDRELHPLIDAFFERPDAESQPLLELYRSVESSLGGLTPELRQRTKAYVSKLLQKRRNSADPSMKPAPFDDSGPAGK